jgi:cyclophilin family peptidyl-prolyl cis-trans isomerase
VDIVIHDAGACSAAAVNSDCPDQATSQFFVGAETKSAIDTAKMTKPSSGIVQFGELTKNMLKQRQIGISRPYSKMTAATVSGSGYDLATVLGLKGTLKTAKLLEPTVEHQRWQSTTGPFILSIWEPSYDEEGAGRCRF